MTKYNKYQDYVIKDGKLIGEFEAMYKDYEDPWEQSIREKDAIEKSIGIELLSKYGHQKPLEFGCGFGNYTQKLYEKCGMAGGVDISETAIKKAKQKFSDPIFFNGDILDRNIIENFKPDCILLVEISWYVLDKLEAFKEIITHTSKGCGFLDTLMTYGPGEQKFGVEYFTNLEEIKKYWSDTIEISDWGNIGNADYNGGNRTFFYGKIK